MKKKYIIISYLTLFISFCITVTIYKYSLIRENVIRLIILVLYLIFSIENIYIFANSFWKTDRSHFIIVLVLITFPLLPIIIITFRSSINSSLIVVYCLAVLLIMPIFIIITIRKIAN